MGGELVPGFVEADVAVASDPEKLKIDAPGSLNRRLISAAFGVQIFGRPVEKMNVRGRKVDGVEQMVIHERPEAAGVRWCDAGEFVEVESNGAGKVDLASRVQPPQLGVSGDRTTAGGQPQNESGLLCECRCDALCECDGGVIRSVEDVDVHALLHVGRHRHLAACRGQCEAHRPYRRLHLKQVHDAARSDLGKPGFDIAHE